MRKGILYMRMNRILISKISLYTFYYSFICVIANLLATNIFKINSFLEILMIYPISIIFGILLILLGLVKIIPIK